MSDPVDIDGATPDTALLAEPLKRPLSARTHFIILAVLGSILAAVLLVFYVLFTPLRVDGESMYPTLHDGDRLLLSKGYDRPVKRDIVMVAEGSSAKFGIIKRIAALGGETIEIKDDVAYVNGSVEDTSGIVIVPAAGVTEPAFRVPDGEVYLLGDNRPVSLDSRFVGPLPDHYLTHKAVFIFWPPSRFGPIP